MNTTTYTKLSCGVYCFCSYKTYIIYTQIIFTALFQLFGKKQHNDFLICLRNSFGKEDNIAYLRQFTHNFDNCFQRNIFPLSRYNSQNSCVFCSWANAASSSFPKFCWSGIIGFQLHPLVPRCSQGKILTQARYLAADNSGARNAILNKICPGVLAVLAPIRFSCWNTNYRHIKSTQRNSTLGG